MLGVMMNAGYTWWKARGHKAPRVVEDVRALCREVAIMHQGRIAARGVPSEMVTGLQGRVWTRAWREGDATASEVMVVRREAGSRVTRLLADSPPDDQSAPVEPTLEDVYFAHMDRRERDQGAA